MSTVAELPIPRGQTFSRPQQRIMASVLLGGLLMLLALAAWLVFRRTAGALGHPLSGSHLAVLAAATTLSLGILRLGLHGLLDAPPPIARKRTTALSILCTLAAVLIAASISGGGSPLGAVTLLWIAVTAEEITGWIAFRRAWLGHALPLQQEETPQSHSTATPMHSRIHLEEPADEEAADLLPDQVSQRLTRALGDTGEEVIYGQLRCHFTPGQRQQNLHVAFCPPLARVPSLSVDQLDGPTARVRATQIQAFGVCIEVRLQAASSEPSDVQVQLFASDSNVAETWG